MMRLLVRQQLPSRTPEWGNAAKLTGCSDDQPRSLFQSSCPPRRKIFPFRGAGTCLLKVRQPHEMKEDFSFSRD